jgi:hypothetical protein
MPLGELRNRGKGACPMKAVFTIWSVAVLLVVPPSPCFALTFHRAVTKAEAKGLGMEVRSEWAGAKQVKVELELKTEGALKDASHVDLRIGEGDNPPVTAPLKEDRSKPGRVVVSFTADHAQLDNLKFWVTVPELDGRTIYDLRVKDFVELKRDR